MNTRVIPLIAAAVSCLWFSCESVQKSRTTKTMEIYGSGVMHLPVLADLAVKETRASGTGSAMSTSYIEFARKEAIANAIENSNADVLVEPVFKSSTIGSRVTVTVTGYPAIYKNFRNASAGDTALLKIGYWQKPVAKEEVVLQKKKGGAAVAVLLISVALIGLIALLAG